MNKKNAKCVWNVPKSGCSFSSFISFETFEKLAFDVLNLIEKCYIVTNVEYLSSIVMASVVKEKSAERVPKVLRSWI